MIVVIFAVLLVGLTDSRLTPSEAFALSQDIGIIGGTCAVIVGAGTTAFLATKLIQRKRLTSVDAPATTSDSTPTQTDNGEQSCRMDDIMISVEFLPSSPSSRSDMKN